MFLLIVFLTLFLGFFIYKKTRSYVYATIAVLIGFILIPFMFDQARLLFAEDKVLNTTGTVSTPSTTSPNTAYRSTAKSCSCNG